MKYYSCEEILSNLENILKIDSSARGIDYLEKLCKNIYSYFDIEYIIIGQAVKPENEITETLVALVNGEIIDNFTYELQNSPCENVCKTQDVCLYDNNVSSDFSKHSLITDLNIEAYVGSPLMLNDNVIGLLVFLESKKIEYPAYINSMIRILSARIAVEIERYNNDQAVKTLQMTNIELSVKNRLDPLTNVYNRNFFYKHVRELLKNNPSGAIMFLDLDDFKKINDTYGHNAGDEVLKLFSKIVQEIIGDSAVFARYGGEEFILFIPNVDKNYCNDISNTIHNSFTATLLSDKNVTVSIGACMVKDHVNLDALIKYADVALYEAKENGKNQTVFA